MKAMLYLLSGLIGVALILFGCYALVATSAVTGMTALEPQGVAGLNEARAIYAGSFWAMGALIVYGLRSPRLREPLLLAVGVIFGGFVVARFMSIGMDGYDPALTAALVSEIAATIVLISAARGRTAAAST